MKEIQPMQSGERKPLHHASPMMEARFVRRADALFRALSTDYLLREQFITDPVRIVADYIMDAPIPAGAADTSNQLVYAVMSNRRLYDWLSRYGSDRQSEVPSRHEFAIHFARAVADSGDDVAVLALIRAATDDRDHFTLETDVLRAIAAAAGSLVRQGTEFTPGTGSTNVSPGTNVTPGSIASVGEMVRVLEVVQRTVEGNPGLVSAGTEFTPGTGGTNVSPGTNITPGSIGSVGEIVRVLQAARRIVLGRSGVFSSGTEFTPGTGGTNVSPGTNITPGSLGSIPVGEMIRVLQTVQRVVQGNRGVFASGTEFTPGTGSTNVSPGTNITPGATGIGEIVRVLQAVQRVVRENRGVFASGTEFTPGTGSTNVSPGTNVTPGSRFRGTMAVTIEGLVQYATRLRETKALFVSGLEGR